MDTVTAHFMSERACLRAKSQCQRFLNVDQVRNSEEWIGSFLKKVLLRINNHHDLRRWFYGIADNAATFASEKTHLTSVPYAEQNARCSAKLNLDRNCRDEDRYLQEKSLLHIVAWEVDRTYACL